MKVKKTIIVLVAIIILMAFALVYLLGKQSAAGISTTGNNADAMQEQIQDAGYITKGDKTDGQQGAGVSEAQNPVPKNVQPQEESQTQEGPKPASQPKQPQAEPQESEDPQNPSFECYKDADCNPGFKCSIQAGDQGGSCVVKIGTSKLPKFECYKDSDCKAGYICKTGKCTAKPYVPQVKKGNGKLCSTNKECLSNYCESTRTFIWVKGKAQLVYKRKCQPNPKVCSFAKNDVCGDDGKTYWNKCYATKADVAFVPGACK